MKKDVKDPVVSQRYREIADEQAPDALNQAVLREARQQPGRRYSRSVSWLRPMAWAASIGLCLAIVVELNNVPRPEPSLEPLPASVPAPARSLLAEEEAPEQGLDATTIAIEPTTTEKRVEPDVEPDVEPGLLPEQLEQRVRKSVDEDGRVTLDDLAQLEKLEAGHPGDAQRNDDFRAVDGPNLDDIETLTRMREGDSASAIPLESPDKDATADAAGGAEDARQAATGAFALRAAPAMEMAISATCEPHERKTPEAWLHCIEGLETDGMTDLAQRERELLLETFPDFELP
jgi:hypothetical protein